MTGFRAGAPSCIYCVRSASEICLKATWTPTAFHKLCELLLMLKTPASNVQLVLTDFDKAQF